MPGSLAGKRMNSELNPGSEARSSNVHRSESHLVLLLALVAMLALFQIRWVSFLHPGRWILITDLLIMLSLTCGMFLFLPSGFGGGRFASRILLGGLLAFPVVTHLLMRFRGWGEASEILMLQLCQNVAIYLVVWPAKSRERFNQLSVLFSFFLVFFATALAETLAVYLVTLSYLVGGVWWLLSRHWRRLQVHMPASVETHFRIRSGSFVLVLGVLLPVALLGDARAASQGEWHVRLPGRLELATD